MISLVRTVRNSVPVHCSMSRIAPHYAVETTDVELQITKTAVVLLFSFSRFYFFSFYFFSKRREMMDSVNSLFFFHNIPASYSIFICSFLLIFPFLFVLLSTFLFFFPLRQSQCVFCCANYSNIHTCAA